MAEVSFPKLGAVMMMILSFVKISDNTFIGNFTAETIQADNGFTGSCVNVTYLGGIAISCND